MIPKSQSAHEHPGHNRRRRVTNTDDLKHCWDCDGWFPPTTQHFYRDRSRKHGLTAACKDCIKRRANDYNHARPAPKRIRKRKYLSVTPTPEQYAYLKRSA